MGAVLNADTGISAPPNPAAARRMRVAFVAGKFPLVSEVFIINQVADLIERGVDVEIFAFERGTHEHISPRFAKHRMSERTHYLNTPPSKFGRLIGALPRIARLLARQPRALPAVFSVSRHGRAALSLRLLYAVAPWAGESFDVVHCHFADIATVYLPIRAILRSTTPMVTTFYGYDASTVFQTYAPDFYARLKTECRLFYVMSENMRRRVIAQGFSAEKISVLPAGIDVDEYPFSERACPPELPVQLLAVGRFVEKKGFGDLLEALAILRSRTPRRFTCSIVGSGPLEGDLREHVRQLGLGDVVSFLGAMAVDRLISLFPQMHMLIAPSKTASNGDME